MKKPDEISTVIRGRVFTLPSYTNIYGKKVNGDNVTIKFYDKSLSVDNHGVDPESLLRAIGKHLTPEESELDSETLKAVSHISEAISILEKRRNYESK